MTTGVRVVKKWGSLKTLVGYRLVRADTFPVSFTFERQERDAMDAERWTHVRLGDADFDECLYTFLHAVFREAK